MPRVAEKMSQLVGEDPCAAESGEDNIMAAPFGSIPPMHAPNVATCNVDIGESVDDKYIDALGAQVAL
jgi:hypothetical protein